MARLAQLTALLACMFAAVWPAAAQVRADACAFTPTILATADYLLKIPANPGNFWRDREGDSAAFLKIRYTPLQTAQAKTVLDELAGRKKPPQRIEELAIAWAGAPERREQAAKLIATEGLSGGLMSIGQSGLRALLLDDDGVWFFNLLSQQPAGGQRPHPLKRLGHAVADVGDVRLERMADQALNAGRWVEALDLRVFQANLSAYVAAVKAVPDSSLPGPAQDAALVRQSLFLRAATESSYSPAQLDLAIQPVEISSLFDARPFQRLMRPVGSLIAQFPEAHLIMTLMNETGDQKLLADIVPAMLDDLASGKIDPVRDPDAAVAAMQGRIEQTLGRDVMLPLLKASPGAKTSRASMLDEAVAITTLKPLLAGSGQTAPAPGRPAALTPEFVWDAWAKQATDLRDGKEPSSDDAIIAARLLIGAGRYDEGLRQLQRAADQDEARGIALDLMRRADRSCADFLRPARPIDEDLFRFDE